MDKQNKIYNIHYLEIESDMEIMVNETGEKLIELY